MPKDIRASVVQCCTGQSLEATLDTLERLALLAKERDGSSLCVFPEAFVRGYPKGSTFGAVVGERYPRILEIPFKRHRYSPPVSRIEDMSKNANIHLVVGVIEREGGTLYCTAIFIDPEHGYVGKHQKLMPTAAERLIWGQGDGSTLTVLEPTFSGVASEPVRAKIAATICWENYMPLLRTYYYSKGVQVYCAPTVDGRPEWQSTMTHIALEGRCFVLSACQIAQEKDFADDHAHSTPSAERNPENVMIAGGSVIVSPLGKVLAGPLRGEEGVLTASLDLDDIIRGKFDLDVVGSYSRNDIFQLQTRLEGTSPQA